VKNDARIVLASSIVVYGDHLKTQACPEETGYGKTFGPYGRTKQAQEKLAWDYHDHRSMKVTIVRPANVYGPASGPWLYDVVNVLKSGAPGLIDGGHGNAGLAYVDNVADMLILAAAAEHAVGRAYNAADDLKVTWQQYFTDIAHMIGIREPKSIPYPLAKMGAYFFEAVWKFFDLNRRPPITHEALNLISSDNRIPIERARKELNFEPKISYAEGIQEIKVYLDKK